jgi:hypothetical protein
MIRVDIEEIENRGVWRYTVAGFAIQGRSRQPLLDACRAIKRTGGDTSQAAGLFRAGRSEPDITVRSVEAGAMITVIENEKTGPRFGRFREMPAEAFAMAAE